MLQVSNISKSYGTQVLFDSASFSMVKGEHLALIGQNGTGKSTLFRMILEEEHADSGHIVLPKSYTVGHLAQHISLSKETILEEACSGLRKEDEGQEYLAKMVLGGLGFSESDYQRSPHEFSGGFQLRISLARTLLSKPNLLLLDEPTNYLDIVSLRWITGFLHDWKDELIVISHDRGFLDSVCSDTMLIYRNSLRKIRGNCMKLLEQVAEEEEVYERTRANLEKKKASLEVFVNRFRAKATKAAAVQSKIKAIERLGIGEELKESETLEFGFTEAPFHGRYLIEASGLSFSYAGHEKQNHNLIEDLSFSLSPGERLAVVGKNGKGKSTLLRLLNHELRILSGNLRVHDNARIGYFGQTNIDALSEFNTIEDEVWSVSPESSRTRIRSICGAMMFEGDSALKKISILSGGERSRVLLAKILASPANLLLLDEPTNHLDIESIESLVEALKQFKGAVVIVTHSELILRELATKLIVFRDNGQLLLDGDYDYFLGKIGWEDENSVKPSATETKGKVIPFRTREEQNARQSHDGRRERGKLVNERSRLLYPLQKEMEAIEAEICALEEVVEDSRNSLIEASSSGDAEAIRSHSLAIKEAEEKIEDYFGRLDSVHGEMNRIKEEYEEKLQ